MDGSVGAAAKVEGEELLGAGGYLLATRGWEGDAVTGEVGTGGIERGFDSRAGNGGGRGDEHVCLGAERQAGGEGSELGEHVVWVRKFGAVWLVSCDLSVEVFVEGARWCR